MHLQKKNYGPHFFSSHAGLSTGDLVATHSVET